MMVLTHRAQLKEENHQQLEANRSLSLQLLLLRNGSPPVGGYQPPAEGGSLLELIGVDDDLAAEDAELCKDWEEKLSMQSWVL